MERLKLREGEPIEAGIVTRSIETAQSKVIYTQRNELLEATDISELSASLRASVF
jgi:preprotein translocase subunit SecA